MAGSNGIGKRLIAAVDGGGTGCRVAIAVVDGDILAEVRGAPANATSDMDGTIAALTSALAEAAQVAGLQDDDLNGASAHFGVAGVIDDQTAGRIVGAFPDLALTVTDDRPTQLRGALGATDGYLAAVGTGSFFGAQRDGAATFAGGYGPLLGDEASGVWLAKRSLAAVLEVVDGLRNDSPFLAGVLSEWGGSSGELIRRAQTATPFELATLAPRLTDAAAASDPEAKAILAEGAGAIRDRLTRMGAGPGSRVRMAGGLASAYAPILARDFRDLAEAPPDSGLRGALQLAGWTVPAT